MNKCILIGNLGKDPELRFTQNNVAVAGFSIATSESFKDRNGERQQKSEWHNIVAWKNLAESCGKYLHKGSKVAVEGKITSRSYEDKQGMKKYTTEIVAKNIEFLDPRNKESNQSQPHQDNNYPDIEDIPF